MLTVHHSLCQRLKLAHVTPPPATIITRQVLITVITTISQRSSRFQTAMCIRRFLKSQISDSTNLGSTPRTCVSNKLPDDWYCKAKHTIWARHYPFKRERHKNQVRDSSESTDALQKGNAKPTPVFLPGKSHAQRSLAGDSPWGCKRVR